MRAILPKPPGWIALSFNSPSEFSCGSPRRSHFAPNAAAWGNAPGRGMLVTSGSLWACPAVGIVFQECTRGDVHRMSPEAAKSDAGGAPPRMVDRGGAAWVTRTPDPRITNALLYRLS